MTVHASWGKSIDLIAELRVRTRELHRIAEHSGIIRELLRGTATLREHAHLLRCLLPVYQHMEQFLALHENSPEFSKLADPALYRSEFMISDLRSLVGEDWHKELSILPIARRYAKRVADLAVSDPALLVGHIYARYLGDLSGGPILKRVLRRALDVPDRALSFYEFPDISDLEKFRFSYLQAIREVTEDWLLIDRITEEAEKAFQFNIDLSEELLSISRE